MLLKSVNVIKFYKELDDVFTLKEEQRTTLKTFASLLTGFNKSLAMGAMTHV